MCSKVVLMLVCMLHLVMCQDEAECSSPSSVIASESVITENGTILHSPIEGPGNFLFPLNTDEFWNITSPNGSIIYLEFICDFGLTGGLSIPTCFHYVEVSSPSIGFTERYCAERPAPILIRSNVATIRFHSEGFLPDSGFAVKINFVSNDSADIEEIALDECRWTGIQMNIKGGIIFRSPIISESNKMYPANARLSSSITAPNGMHLSLQFICEFDVQSTEDGCIDSLNITSSEIGFQTQLCGSSFPEPFIIKSNEMSISFQSDAIVEGFGFVLKVTFVSATDIKATTDPPHVVTTPTAGSILETTAVLTAANTFTTDSVSSSAAGNQSVIVDTTSESHFISTVVNTTENMLTTTASASTTNSVSSSMEIRPSSATPTPESSVSSTVVHATGNISTITSSIGTRSTGTLKSAAPTTTSEGILEKASWQIMSIMIVLSISF